jgi:hypothetical protein
MMKLSEAILLGSVGTGQAFGILDDGQGNTCAMGAALSAAGLSKSTWQLHYLEDHFPIAYKKVKLPNGLEWKRCFTGNHWVEPWEYIHDVRTAIAILNNVYKWTRPQIATWVATIEPQEDQCTTTQTTQTSQQCQDECLNSSIKNQETETNQNLNQTVS